jgi:hypothetical protein
MDKHTLLSTADLEQRTGAALHDRFDYWAGRVIDLLAGVGLIASLVIASAVAGYIWGL